jgi:hypothetical protein
MYHYREIFAVTAWLMLAMLSIGLALVIAHSGAI